MFARGVVYRVSSSSSFRSLCLSMLASSFVFGGDAHFFPSHLGDWRRQDDAQYISETGD